MTYVLFTVNPGAGGGDLRIDVNLRTQYMIVYQGTNVLGRSYVSTGRPGFDTPTGTYYINRKVLVKDMSGVLGGEYYHVRDVPHVMYFTNRGHAIHGTYWHNNFGYVMSHGCVNLPQGFASWLYGITPLGTRMTIHF
jgi:lipoprotein-anchoring transpeptidase ErfK/SrfK